MIGREAAGDEDDAIGLDQAGDELLGRSVDPPDRLAGVGVVADDALAAAEDELLAAGERPDDRRAIRTRLVRPVGTPQLAAGFFVEGDDRRGGRILIAVQDHAVSVKHRRAAETVNGMKLCGRAAPDFAAVQVAADQLNSGDVKEGNPYMLLVRGGGGAGIAVQIVLGLEHGPDDEVLPEELSAGAVEAEQHALALIFEAGGEEDAIAEDDGRGVAFAGDGGFPPDVFRGGPMGGDVGFAGSPVAAWAAPLGPVFGERASCSIASTVPEEGSGSVSRAAQYAS